jgi:hypothetical protein
MIIKDGLFQFTTPVSLNNLLVHKDPWLLSIVITQNIQFGHWLKMNFVTILLQSCINQRMNQEKVEA